jgi:hypothetical protein
MRFICTLLITLPACALTSAQIPEDLAHLPAPVAADITAWRHRLQTARCLYVDLDTDQTWARMHELDARGNPVVYETEHLRTVTWMTSSTFWTVVTDHKDDDRPVNEIAWDNGAVWERWWSPEDDAYKTRRYECEDDTGPGDSAYPAKGCIFASGLNSWLAGAKDLDSRGGTVRSLAFMRSPNLAIVPPDPAQAGVWLDVFDDELVRNRQPGTDSLYRRNDFMLLARNDEGEPEMREWRTIVMTDSDSAGAEMYQIVGVRRMKYEAHETIPRDVRAEISAFKREVDAATPD